MTMEDDLEIKIGPLRISVSGPCSSKADNEWDRAVIERSSV